MSSFMRLAVLPLLVLVTFASALRAEDQPQPVKWNATDIRNAAVAVPADKPTVLLFLRVDQPQSQSALQDIKNTVKDPKSVQLVAIVSGQDADAGAKKLAEGNTWPGAIVADPDYAATGQLGVHVWPTTLVIAPSGLQIAHLGGISKSFASDLDAYVAFAAGKIDRAALDKRLNNSQVVADSPEQMAARHLEVAQRLLDEGSLDQAARELADGLKLQPNSPALQLAQANLLLLQGQADAAMKILAGLDASAAPAWRMALLRGRALIALEKWDEAKTVLTESLKLNPNPAEARYCLGLVYAHAAQWQQAAENFRAAYESSTAKGPTTKP